MRQRADRYGKIGRPKSEAGERTVPLPPMVVTVLREHRLACPNGVARPRLPEQQGQHRASQQHRRARLASGADRRRRGQAGQERQAGRQVSRPAQRCGISMRSWCINRRVDGGLELPLKVVQARLGHASIQMTADTYGHLFPRGDDGAELAAAEKAFLAG